MASRCSPEARSARRVEIRSAVTPLGSRITACVPRPSLRAVVRYCNGAVLRWSRICGIRSAANACAIVDSSMARSMSASDDVASHPGIDSPPPAR